MSPAARHVRGSPRCRPTSLFRRARAQHPRRASLLACARPREFSLCGDESSRPRRVLLPSLISHRNPPLQLRDSQKISQSESPPTQLRFPPPTQELLLLVAIPPAPSACATPSETQAARQPLLRNSSFQDTESSSLPDIGQIPRNRRHGCSPGSKTPDTHYPAPPNTPRIARSSLPEPVKLSAPHSRALLPSLLSPLPPKHRSREYAATESAR